MLQIYVTYYGDIDICLNDRNNSKFWVGKYARELIINDGGGQRIILLKSGQWNVLAEIFTKLKRNLYANKK